MMTTREEENLIRKQTKIYEDTLIFWFSRVDKLLELSDALEASFESDEEIREDLEVACLKLNYELARMSSFEKKIDDFLDRTKER